MMNGLVEISDDEFDKYIAGCADFMCVDTCIYGLDLVVKRGTQEVVGYKDFNGKAFSRTKYWDVSISA